MLSLFPQLFDLPSRLQGYDFFRLSIIPNILNLMDETLPDSSQLSETLPSEPETAQLFRDFKAVLRATGFKTPLQRASSLAKSVKAASLTLKRVSNAESLWNLLPPGANTVYKADIVSVIAASGKSYYIRLPVTLLWTTGRGKIVSTGFDGSAKVRHVSDLKSALICFSSEISRMKLGEQKFTVKRAKESAVLFDSFNEVEQVVLANSNSDIRAEIFIEPQTRKTAVLRAHWMQGRPRNAYYAKTGGLRLENTPQCLAKRMKELTRSFSNIDTRPTPHGKLTLMRLKPIPDIDNSLNESVKALNEILRSQTVTQILCDFVQDVSNNWVLVDCLGYLYSSHKKAVSLVVEQKQQIDMNFILFPLFTRKDSIRKRLQEQNAPSKAEIRRVTVIEYKEQRPKADEEVIARRQEKSRLMMKKSKMLFALPELGFYNRTISKYEQVMKGVNQHKEQLNGKLDFLSKYGEAFWEPILLQIYAVFLRDEHCLMKYYDSLNFEEENMILRGYKRVLQGSYNFYYKSMLTLAHCSKGISYQEYDSFQENVKNVLLDTSITRHDLEIIMTRFRDLRSCICPHANSQ